MGTSKATLKKDLRTNVSRTLEEVFKDFESLVGKRKFRRNIKKASKILTSDVKPHKANGKVPNNPADLKHEAPENVESPLEITSEAAAL